MSDPSSLPKFVPPMLAVPSQPLDSNDHIFEVKWDGIRALALVEPDVVRIVTRHAIEVTPRYPELSLLGQLKPGTVLDGELVVLASGKPDFSCIARRHHTLAAHKIHVLSAQLPATYVVFDQLYQRYEPLLGRPLWQRRDILQETLAALDCRHVAFSRSVVGSGCALYEQVIQQKLEGVVAKRRDSRYTPGRRSQAWLKIKPESQPTRGRK